MTRNLPYDRAARVADQIHHIITTSCVTELSDPRLEGLEITRVVMTKDLKTARVYYHMHSADSASIERARDGLTSAQGFLKKRIKEEIELRYIPDLQFFYDETIDLQEKIDSLMSEKSV